MKNLGAVTISGSDPYFDGGSIAFTLQSQTGASVTIVLSNELQRKELSRSLSIGSLHIQLVPEAYYQRLASLLHGKLSAGINSGLQEKWNSYSPKAMELNRLLIMAGYHGDLDTSTGSPPPA